VFFVLLFQNLNSFFFSALFLFFCFYFCQSPSNPVNPVSLKIVKYFFVQFVNTNSKQMLIFHQYNLQNQKKLSLPLPSNPCEKKSQRISFFNFSTPPNVSSIYFDKIVLSVKLSIFLSVKTIGDKILGT